MKSHPVFQKAIKTTEITKEEAKTFFDDLYKETDLYVRNNWKYYVNNGMWPIKARVRNGAQKDPVFIVNHCTGSKDGKHEPALHRFFQSKMASAHILITITGNLIYLVPLTDLAYHATKRSGVILGALAAMLKINDSKFLNEPGIEVVGSGNIGYFTPEQFISSIVVQRIMVAYFGNSIKDIKSHRFFSPTSRPGDPGALYFLPLVKHAVFTNYDLSDDEYWIEEFKRDQKKFAEGFQDQLKKYGILSHEDEWASYRLKMKLP